MLFIIGFIVVQISIWGGFWLAGGKFGVILKSAPFELMIIFGSGIGAFIIANSSVVLKGSISGISKIMKGAQWKEEHYKEVLGLMFLLVKTMRTKGVVAVESHIENPEDSKIFQHFSAVSHDHHIVDFIADYMRMMTMNFEDPMQMEDAMDKDLEKIHHEEQGPAHALQVLADGLPALGIVAAVLGIIKAMGAISEPVEILGGMVAGALVGTLLGIYLSYTLVGPMAVKLGAVVDEEHHIFDVIKIILISYLHGNAPQIAVEIGRRNIPTPLQPSFSDIEEYLGDIPPEL